MTSKIKNQNPPQQRLAAAGVLLLVVLLISCRDQQVAVEAETSGLTPQAARDQFIPPSAQGGSSVSNFQGAIKKDMAYADLRKLLLDGGWEPVKDPQCQVKVAGYDEKACSENPGLALCKACSQIPELSAYSGDGYATVRFRRADDGEELKVVSYGMIEDWSVAGEDSRLRVEEWENSKTSTP